MPWFPLGVGHGVMLIGLNPYPGAVGCDRGSGAVGAGCGIPACSFAHVAHSASLYCCSNEDTPDPLPLKYRVGSPLPPPPLLPFPFTALGCAYHLLSIHNSLSCVPCRRNCCTLCPVLTLLLLRWGNCVRNDPRLHNYDQKTIFRSSFLIPLSLSFRLYSLSRRGHPCLAMVPLVGVLHSVGLHSNRPSLVLHPMMAHPTADFLKSSCPRR